MSDDTLDQSASQQQQSAADDQQQPPAASQQGVAGETGPAGEPGAQPQGESAPAKTMWGDNWRQDYAGEDEKMLKRLERYSSPKDALDALIAAQRKLSSGEFQRPLKPDATPEEVAAWRSENGIPDSPEGYDVKLDGGYVVGEADRPMVDAFLKTAHDANMTPAQVKTALGWYASHQEKFLQAQAEADVSYRAKATDELRAEWGADYRRNVNLATSTLENAPPGLADNILGARLADGTPLGNNPDALRWLANLAREINPAATVLPNAGGNSLEALGTERANIEALMGDRTSKYWKGPESEKLQQRYRDIIAAQDKISRKG